MAYAWMYLLLTSVVLAALTAAVLARLAKVSPRATRVVMALALVLLVATLVVWAVQVRAR